MKVESGTVVSVYLSRREAKALARVLQGVGVPTDDREASDVRLTLVDGLLQHLYEGGDK